MYSPRNAGGLAPEVASEFQFLSAKLKAWAAVDHNEDGTHRVTSASASNRVVGEIVMWGTTTAPANWLLCDGSQVSRTTYQSLFELWGTTFGVGDGSTTFHVPDMRQRVPLGKASSGTGNTIGDTGGDIDHTHILAGGTTGANGGFSTSTNAAGSHAHGGATGADAAQATVQIDATGPDPVSVSIGPHTHGISSTSDHTHTVTVGDHTHSFSGGTTDGGNMPYLVLNFIVFVGV